MRIVNAITFCLFGILTVSCGEQPGSHSSQSPAADVVQKSEVSCIVHTRGDMLRAALSVDNEYSPPIEFYDQCPEDDLRCLSVANSRLAREIFKYATADKGPDFQAYEDCKEKPECIDYAAGRLLKRILELKFTDIDHDVGAYEGCMGKPTCQDKVYTTVARRVYEMRFPSYGPEWHAHHECLRSLNKNRAKSTDQKQ